MDYQTVVRLKTALKNPELLGTMPPVLAIGLGVIPLQVSPDYVMVGHVPELCPDVFKFLERYFGKEIVPVRLQEEVAQKAIWEAYFNRQPINHDTFPDANFLLQPECESKLLNEKEEELGPLSCDLREDEIVFMETSYYSRLLNLDRNEKAGEIEIKDDALPFKIIGDRPVVFGDPVPDDAFLVERRNYIFEGTESRHGILRTDLRNLPHVIHPTEVQLTQIAEDGSLTFYVYDHLEKVKVGESRHFEFPYHFISFGSRYSRVLSLTIHTVFKCLRDSICYTADELTWDEEDIRRWFRQEG